MAKRERVRKITGNEVPTSQPLSEIEQADAARASATAEATGKNSETGNTRLPYQLLTKEAMEYVHAVAPWLTRHENFGVFEAPARLAGASLTLDWAREFVGLDGPEVTCPEKKGGSPCGYKFQARRQADFDKNEDGSFKGSFRTDERLLSETNPKGIVYRGSYLAVPVSTIDRYSKLTLIGPMCRRDQKITAKVYFDATGKWPKAFDSTSGAAFVTAVNAGKDASKQAHLDRKDEIARERGIRPRGEGGFNSPHRATAGRQGRRQADPREPNISNRS